jgi:CheY-like chemotaxis protein
MLVPVNAAVANTMETLMPIGPVLIVEDDPDLLTMFKTILRRTVRPELILTANGGDAALRNLKAQTPSVVLLDLAMPHVSGNDVIHYVLSQPRLDSSRIVVVTAVPMRLSVEGLARVSDVLTKPISPRDLENAVARFGAEFAANASDDKSGA